MNLRPVTARNAICDCSPLRPEVVRGVDILIVRELLGGLYFGEPRGLASNGGKPSVFNTMRYSIDEIKRVAHVAFEAAATRRKKVTSADKANVLEVSRLWRETVSSVAREYPEVALEHLYVDTCAMNLIMNPRSFDVILTENLFGGILSDEAAAIAGSLGVLDSGTVGGAVDLYEPVHGSAPDIAGRDLANPIGAICSAASLLRRTARLDREADAVLQAVHEVLEAGFRTADLAGRSGTGTIVGTSRMGTLIVAALTRQSFAPHRNPLLQSIACSFK